MNFKNKEKTYVAFLRGINVGGHHKVPMAELKNELLKVGCKKVETILNSGNVIFETEAENTELMESQFSEHLEKTFKFPIPIVIVNAEELRNYSDLNPFRDITVTKDVRLYVSFLKKEQTSLPDLPFVTPDGSYKIIQKTGKSVFSVLDLSVTKTPDAMKVLENFCGKDITTRNWNTIERIQRKIIQ